ncbi:hypothetical protein [Nocardioides lijunqiniae]|uniref:hypothetical protein n=1 Tax=Nocardioides lijunqiniae TaxID=2760832 RepID=UPI0018779DC4|nr:hypothetical protein [Nocardioides lijunqiniae]
MELQPVPDPTGDPFFDALRRRHPDVDVVLLPPEPPPADPDAVVDEDLPGAVLARVATLAEDLWAAAARDSDAVPEARMVYGDGPGAVRAASRVATRRDDGFHVLVALRHELETHGWAVTRPPGAVERIEGHLDDLTVTASYVEGTGALLFRLTSGSLTVGLDRARELTRHPGGGR